ncbi:MAG: Ca-activated chloride channel family protein [Myxococcota bacterium]|jgi:Ca-activated chloride channel family protein
MPMKLLLVPRRAALLAGHVNELDVLCRLQAPPAPPNASSRPPLNMAIVLDRSGSMAGQPLTEAIRCAGFMLERLTASDRASIVVYDNNVEVLVPSIPVVDRGRFRRALASIVAGGSTALHGGWLAGAEQVAAHLRGDRISRVLLLSDGRANHGLTDAAQIRAQCLQLSGEGVTTSTYGLGERFNEELMAAMADAGRGNSYYGKTADDLVDPFQEEFELLSAMCAHRIRLTLRPAAGVEVAVRNGYPQQDGAILLPDLAHGGEAWALLKLRVPRAVAIDPRAVLLEASVSMMDMQGQPAHIDPSSLRLPAVTASAYAAVAEDDLVRRRSQEMDAAQLQDQARIAALAGDWTKVTALLEQARAQAADNPWVSESLTVLERYARQRQSRAFSKEAWYKSRKMRSRLTAHSEEEWSDDENTATYLRRKREQGRR